MDPCSFDEESLKRLSDEILGFEPSLHTLCSLLCPDFFLAMIFSDPGKGLCGSRPHAEHLRMRARAALHSPAVSAAGLDHLPFYAEGTLRSAEGNVIPNRDRCPTLPGDPRISFKTNSSQKDTSGTISGRSAPPRAVDSALPHP